MFNEVTFHNPANYLSAVKAQRKMTRITQVFFFSLVFLAFIGCGYTVYTFGPFNQAPNNGEMQTVVGTEEGTDNQVGVVDLAFDPTELDTVEDWAVYLEADQQESFDDEEDEWMLEMQGGEVILAGEETNMEQDENLTVSNF